MRIAENRGWSLESTLEQVTTDEIMLWEEYWFQELNNPDRICYYLMGVMAENRRPHVKHPSSVKIEDMKIKFQDKRRKPTSQLTEQQRIERAKQGWFGGLGGPPGTDTRGKRVPIQIRKIRPNQT